MSNEQNPNPWSRDAWKDVDAPGHDEPTTPVHTPQAGEQPVQPQGPSSEGQGFVAQQFSTQGSPTQGPQRLDFPPPAYPFGQPSASFGASPTPTATARPKGRSTGRGPCRRRGARGGRRRRCRVRGRPPRRPGRGQRRGERVLLHAPHRDPGGPGGPEQPQLDGRGGRGVQRRRRHPGRPARTDPAGRARASSSTARATSSPTTTSSPAAAAAPGSSSCWATRPTWRRWWARTRPRTWP